MAVAVAVAGVDVDVQLDVSRQVLKCNISCYTITVLWIGLCIKCMTLLFTSIDPLNLK